MISRILCWMVGIVNSSPGDRRTFYPIKDHLLNRYATRDGHDMQEITKRCYSCRGTGVYNSDWDDECYRCNGTGIYERFWVKLERWRWHGRVFHRPTGARFWTKPESAVTIEGYVTHAPVDGRLRQELELWLLFLFAFRAWLKALRSQHGTGVFPWPMRTLQRIVCAVAWNIPKRMACSCGRRYWHWSPVARGQLRLVCGPCWNRDGDDDGIPF